MKKLLNICILVSYCTVAGLILSSCGGGGSSSGSGDDSQSTTETPKTAMNDAANGGNGGGSGGGSGAGGGGPGGGGDGAACKQPGRITKKSGDQYVVNDICTDPPGRFIVTIGDGECGAQGPNFFEPSFEPLLIDNLGPELCDDVALDCDVSYYSQCSTGNGESGDDDGDFDSDETAGF